ncbi:penicillin-binding protein 1C [Marinilabiliaceae bacterium JC040]|nr:penicillin-binding protein 1C [Marinilabiliaceae bacterium JC040]
MNFKLSNKRKLIKRILIVSSLFLFILFWQSLPQPLFKNPKSTILLDRNKNILGVKLASDEQWRLPLQTTIPDKYKKALLCFEDEYFYYHLGVNPVSLFRALFQYIKRGKIISGASTISMQVIRLSRGNKSRTIGEKLVEMILATRLELSYSKEEILKLYAENTPFGGNIVGLESASWKYFHRRPLDLSWAEAALLAVLPNAPSLIYPGKNTDILKKKRDFLLNKMYKKGIIDSLTCSLSKEEIIDKKVYSFPHIAPHLLERASKEREENVVNTSIDIEYQKIINRLLNEHSKILQANGVNNMACLVVDIHTKKVIAYIGNSKSTKGHNNGNMVDIISSARSSGSILKPFLYAILQDEGYILPTTIVADIPTNFGSYTPKNYSLRYDGAVKASDALARSLNIPSVKMLQMISYNIFYKYLNRLGFSTINRGADNYGLSLILGGAEVSLEDVVSAYLGMSSCLIHYNEDDGNYYKNEYSKLDYILSEKENIKEELQTKPIISASAIYLTYKALLKVKRPEQETGWDSFLSANKISWKTGTSFGFRDAWAVGINKNYIVGVWAGNADGEGRAGLLGAKSAAPLMFDVFNSLPSKEWYEQPTDEMVKMEICTKSGYRASRYCKIKDTIWAMKSGLKTELCPYCREYKLSPDKKYRVNSKCESISNMCTKSYFVLPPVMEYFYKKVDPSYESLPPYRYDCKENNSSKMDIIYPEPNASLFIPRLMGGKKGFLVFEAVHSSRNTPIHWYIDKEYIGTTIGDHIKEVRIQKGKHILTIVDGKGQELQRLFKVK